MRFPKRNYPLEFYCELLAAGKPFSLARFGDGEWRAILGKGKATGSGSQRFTAALRERLRGAALAENLAFYGARFGKFTAARRWILSKGCSREWHNAAVFADAYASGSIRPFTHRIRQHAGKRIIVGPAHLKRLKVFRRDEMVMIPDRNCFNRYPGICRVLRRVMSPGALVLISAGPAGKLLVADFCDAYPDSWFIDVGSLWDNLCGVRSRTYHRAVRISDLKV